MPHLIRPRLIVGSYNIGKGVKEDPIRNVETLSFPDGEVLATRDVLSDTVEVRADAFARLMQSGRETS